MEANLNKVKKGALVLKVGYKELMKAPPPPLPPPTSKIKLYWEENKKY